MSLRLRSIGKHWGFELGLMVGLGLATTTHAAWATEYYVAPAGSDSSPGTIAQPFATLQKGANVAVAGDTVYIRGGTYKITTPANSGAGIAFTKSGTSDTSRIKYWAYPGEVPVFDFADMTLSTTGYTHGFVVTGSWLHFKGIEIINVKMNTRSNNAVAVSKASNDIFELMNLHHLMGTGIFIGYGNGGHLLLNCDAHDNYDPYSSQGDGQNADGFGVHYQTTGVPTILRGCRAWWNSDDGYDLINHEVPVTIENCWAMGNGYADYGNTNPASGNGNGFKAGSSATGVRHIIRNSVAWKNKAAGFYANHSSGGNTWYNNTSYSNGTQYNMLASPAGDSATTIILTGTLVHIMRNNIGFPNKNANMGGVDTAFNSWDLNLTPAAADFLSVTDPSMTVKALSAEDSGALGPRQAGGSLPNVDFLKLVAGSKMIDKGTDVGLPFVGSAPDLGAYEYGATTAAGGATALGGTTGAGGATATGGAQSAGGQATGGTATAGGSAAGGRAAGGVSAVGGATATTGGTTTAGGKANTGAGGAVASNGGSVTGIGGSQSQGGGAAVGVGGASVSASGGESAAAGGAVATATGGTPPTSALGGIGQGGSQTPSTGIGGAAVVTTGPGDLGDSGGGCSCAIPGSTSGKRSAGALASVLGVLGLVLRRRRRA